jgi:4-hydroxy-4-methyl-2-oxoglutarate aldolase
MSAENVAGQIGLVRRNIVRADQSAVQRLSGYGVATVHEAMGRTGLMRTSAERRSRCCCILAITG